MHTDRLFGEPDGAYGTSDNGELLVFACARCDEVISEPVVLRNLFNAHIDHHFRNAHGLDEWSIRNLDVAAQSALQRLWEGQPEWLHGFDGINERN